MNARSLTEKRLFLSVYVDDIKLAGKKQNIDPVWKILMKDVDLGEPTSFLDHVCLGGTQRECQTSEDLVDNYRDMFESKISAGAIEKTPRTGKPDANISSFFCWLRPIRVSLKFSSLQENTSSELILVLHDHSLALPSASGNLNNSPFLDVNISFALSIRAWISEASNLPSSSISATIISPYQILPATNAYSRNFSGKTFLPNWWSLHWSLAEVG